MSQVLYIPDLARELNMSESALASHVHRDRSRDRPVLPRPFKLGRRLAWRRADVDKWLAKQGRSAGRPRKTEAA